MVLRRKLKKNSGFGSPWIGIPEKLSVFIWVKEMLMRHELYGKLSQKNIKKKPYHILTFGKRIN